MLKLRHRLATSLLLVGVAALAAPVTQAQTTGPRADASRSATVPGVTRAIEHPDPAVDQTQPDDHQPQTAVDPPSSGPETAQDDQRGKPETATDSPQGKPETATDKPKKSATEKAADQAAQGVRSNTPPQSKPRD
jgi:hypothetical protein